MVVSCVVYAQFVVRVEEENFRPLFQRYLPRHAAFSWGGCTLCNLSYDLEINGPGDASSVGAENLIVKNENKNKITRPEKKAQHDSSSIIVVKLPYSSLLCWLTINNWRSTRKLWLTWQTAPGVASSAPAERCVQSTRGLRVSRWESSLNQDRWETTTWWCKSEEGSRVLRQCCYERAGGPTDMHRSQRCPEYLIALSRSCGIWRPAHRRQGRLGVSTPDHRSEVRCVYSLHRVDVV